MTKIGLNTRNEACHNQPPPPRDYGKICRLLTLALLSITLFSKNALALDNCVIPHGDTYYVDEHGQCREVTNNHVSGLSVMVPTRTAAEWSTGANNFIANAPAGISLVTCSGGGGGATPSGSWSQIGSGSTTNLNNNTKPASLDANTIVVQTSSNIITYTWNGTTWVETGTPYFNSGPDTNGMTRLNSSHIAQYNGDTDLLAAFHWSGSSWSQVGSTVSIPSAERIVMATLSNNRILIAYEVSRTYYIRIYDWNGSSWTQVGSETTGIGLLSVAVLDPTTIVSASGSFFFNYEYNGTEWVMTNFASVSGLSNRIAIAGLDSSNIAVVDGDAGQLKTFRWNGSSWSQVGSARSVPVGTRGGQYLTRLDGTSIVFYDRDRGQRSLIKYQDTGPAGSPIVSCTEKP